MSSKYLASGGFGDVIKVTKGGDRETTVALKLILPRCEKEIDNLKREIEIMSKIVHPNIALASSSIVAKEFNLEEISKFLSQAHRDGTQSIQDSSCVSSDNTSNGDSRLVWGISMQLYGPDLETWLNYTFKLRNNFDPHSAKMAIKIVRGIIRGLKYLHRLNIMHRDLKPNNILFSNSASANEFKFPVIITDFGLSKEIPEQVEVHYPAQGNARFRAPEVWDGNEVTLQAEVYSLGLLILVVLLPIQGKHVQSVASEIIQNHKESKFIDVNNELNFFFSSVVKMIQPKTEERMSCQEFNSFDVPWDHINVIDFQKLIKSLINQKYFLGSKY